jgi:hypothetical protein
MTTLGVRLACSSNGISRAFVRIVSNSAPVPSVPAPGPDPTLFSFTLQGQTNPGGPHDVRLVATYVPCPLGSQTQRCPFDAPRGSFETRQAQQDSPINFHYDTNRGNFEQRPSGACDNFSNNPTYFKISMRSDVGISSCRYQASWDRAELACPPAAVDLFNQATEITLNTDDRAIDPRTCAQFRDPVVTILPIEQEGYIRLLFDIGGATYVRRLNFINHR